ncbi:Uma2 family endonuclease [Paractinoplanes deccanensis]|uniref:Uma2 family endonuclease n=1 Tax=Paractinoplanes deccanensis TaxID=113561 RepID=UPI001EF3545B|nr:Uma2 family endonuclease [Actinoplanes deccanensis]
MVNQEQAVLVSSSNELKPGALLIRTDGANRSPVRAADVPLVVEIISRSSVVYDRKHKMKSYAVAGIPSYWIIDPLADRVTFTQYLLGPDGNYHQQLQTDELVTVHQPWEITLDLPAWTRKRDWIERNARP